MACQRSHHTIQITLLSGLALCVECGSLFSYRLPWKDFEYSVLALRCPTCRALEPEPWLDTVYAEYVTR